MTVINYTIPGRGRNRNLPLIFLFVLLASTVIISGCSRTVQTTTPGSLVRLDHSPALIRAGGDSIPQRKIIHNSNREFWIPVGLNQHPDTFLVELETGSEIKIQVHPGDFPVEHITIDDPGQVHLSSSDLQRHRRESDRLDKLMSTVHKQFWSEPFVFPVKTNYPASNSFGARRVINEAPRSPHSGEDYSIPSGTPVRAINRGKVVLASNLFFAGNSVLIDHGNSLVSHYYHLDSIDVEPGQIVDRAEIIGTVGATGRVTGAHLHLGITMDGYKLDPKQFFRAPLGSKPPEDPPLLN